MNDLLLRDTSPRDAWAGITDEKVMRREIARELSHAANGLYKVDQEAVTADEKETDIRLRSVVSEHEAVIELKLGDSRPIAGQPATCATRSMINWSRNTWRPRTAGQGACW